MKKYVLIVMTIFLSNCVFAIEGYKDFKFGMSYNQIRASGICEWYETANVNSDEHTADGCYNVVGKKRQTKFYFTSTEKNDLIAIRMSMGQSTKEYFNKL